MPEINRLWLETYANQFRRDAAYRETPSAVGEFLYGLLRMERPRNCIELGAHDGTTSVWLYAAILENAYGHLTLYERGDVKKLRDNLRAVSNDNLSQVTIVEGDLFRTLTKDPVDFAFIDHEPKDSYLHAWRMIEWNDKALLAAHDLTYPPAAGTVEKFGEMIARHEWATLSLYNYRGLVLGRKV